MTEMREQVPLFGSCESALLWLGEKFNGPYLTGNWRPHLIPIGSLRAPTSNITSALVNDFYPGVLRIAPVAAPAIAVAAKLRGCYSNAALKTFKKSLQLKSFCVASGNWNNFIRPLAEHPTWTFVDLALRCRETGDTAYIDEAWRLGISVQTGKYVDEKQKLRTDSWSREDAEAYIERITALAGLIEATGVLPSAEDLQRRSGRQDEDIGVAIDEQGSLLHFRKGHHRMMLAKQMNINKINVSVHVVHSKWIEQVTGMQIRRLSSPLASDMHAQARIQNAIREYFEDRLER